MRRGLLVIGLVVAGIAAFVGMTLLAFFQVGMVQRALSLGECNTSVVFNVSGVTDRARRDVESLNPESRSIVQRIIEIGRQRGHEPKAWQVAIQAGKTESNLRNINYGDRDSLGIFQMRPSMGWGTPAQITTIDYAINTFYDRLLLVRGWETLRPGDAAQAVERSAYPDRYHRWEAMALHLIAAGGGLDDPTGCATTGPTTAQAVLAVAFARDQLGDPYVWGATGPNAWDCSGLTQAAWRAAGITLPRTSREQYRAGRHIPVDQAQPGDLLFWSTDGSPAGVHHVALALGDGRVLHAPETGKTVEIRPRWDRELMPHAVRPGA